MKYDLMACLILIERLRVMPKGAKKKQMERAMRKFLGPK